MTTLKLLHTLDFDMAKQMDYGVYAQMVRALI